MSLNELWQRAQDCVEESKRQQRTTNPNDRRFIRPGKLINLPPLPHSNVTSTPQNEPHLKHTPRPPQPPPKMNVVVQPPPPTPLECKDVLTRLRRSHANTNNKTIGFDVFDITPEVQLRSPDDDDDPHRILHRNLSFYLPDVYGHRRRQVSVVSEEALARQQVDAMASSMVMEPQAHTETLQKVNRTIQRRKKRRHANKSIALQERIHDMLPMITRTNSRIKKKNELRTFQDSDVPKVIEQVRKLLGNDVSELTHEDMEIERDQMDEHEDAVRCNQLLRVSRSLPSTLQNNFSTLDLFKFKMLVIEEQRKKESQISTTPPQQSETVV